MLPQTICLHKPLSKNTPHAAQSTTAPLLFIYMQVAQQHYATQTTKLCNLIPLIQNKVFPISTNIVGKNADNFCSSPNIIWMIK
jgi:hypothetical protein